MTTRATPIKTEIGPWQATTNLRILQIRDCTGIPTMKLFQQNWQRLHWNGWECTTEDEWRDVPVIEETQRES